MSKDTVGRSADQDTIINPFPGCLVADPTADLVANPTSREAIRSRKQCPILAGNMGLVERSSITSVPARWDTKPTIAPLLADHVIVARTADRFRRYYGGF